MGLSAHGARDARRYNLELALQGGGAASFCVKSVFLWEKNLVPGFPPPAKLHALLSPPSCYGHIFLAAPILSCVYACVCVCVLQSACNRCSAFLPANA